VNSDKDLDVIANLLDDSVSFISFDFDERDKNVIITTNNMDFLMIVNLLEVPIPVKLEFLAILLEVVPQYYLALMIIE
jgi:hypothetical protein